MDKLFLLRFTLVLLDVNALSYLTWKFVKKKEEVSSYFSFFLIGRLADSLGILITMWFYYVPLPLMLNLKRVCEMGFKTGTTVAFAMYIFGIIGNRKTDPNVV